MGICECQYIFFSPRKADTTAAPSPLSRGSQAFKAGCERRREVDGAADPPTLNLRLKDLLGPVTRVKKKKKHSQGCGDTGLTKACRVRMISL